MSNGIRFGEKAFILEKTIASQPGCIIGEWLLLGTPAKPKSPQISTNFRNWIIFVFFCQLQSRIARRTPQTQNPPTLEASRCCVSARSIANQVSLYDYVANSPAVAIKSIKKIQKSSRGIGNQDCRVRRYRKICLLPQKSDSDAPYKRGCSAEIVAKTDNFCPKPLHKIIGCDL